MAKRQISILWVSAHYKSANAGGTCLVSTTAAASRYGVGTQVIDLDVGLFQLAGRGVQLGSFTDRINTVVTAGMKCIRANRMGDAVQPLP